MQTWWTVKVEGHPVIYVGAPSAGEAAQGAVNRIVSEARHGQLFEVEVLAADQQRLHFVKRKSAVV